ncbi:phage host specificity protein [Amylibacter marinus]|uniref:Phage host specificity protein n=1 Tax=Amylibacter marinus TaxID=1475483 RepID=A0ABQ5VRL9_9RHOB|nr:glycoside hydrolase TIM-barrel-like domain-containing protein [Amylibacter marinus]GLQ34062.1 phage host specificity protein [Amylibacter marinus]
MATLVLSAAGAALGGSVGGAVLGISTAAIGQALGASIGGVIDQSLFGVGDQTIASGQIDSFRLQSSAEGAAIPRLAGRTRVAGQLIWASDFYEAVSSSSSGGGKFNSQPTITTNAYSYSVNLAFALCEGEIVKIGRIWADGEEVDRSALSYTVYTGSADQQPDPTISAHEGIENTPAFRGTAYIVFDEMQLEQFGNRIPQLNFEVFRRAEPLDVDAEVATDMIPAVALIPGSGEYSLATTPVSYRGDYGNTQSANVHTNRGKTDFALSMDDLKTDLPNCNSISLVVSWFGSDLRCGQCELRPKVEHKNADGHEMPWRVGPVSRGAAQRVSVIDERPVFGGTPCDASIVEAISHISNAGQQVVFYPFILMDIQVGNALPDPYGFGAEQPAIPWRGRITASVAPNMAGTTDKTALIHQEVDQFFGSAGIEDFSIENGEVSYSGPSEWSYRRFILHNAYLCALAGGVEAFCIGSELRGITRLRDETNGFPVVQHLMQLADDVRNILGASTKIGYAADWSEYFGYHPADGSGDVFYNLDQLWAHENIDFVGIDNYMPLSDWRDTPGHQDEAYGEIYNQQYLMDNIEGGEGFDWYYGSDLDRESQIRTPITDGAYQEPWTYRYKDIRNWWGNYHYDRIGGVKSAEKTSWEPQGKPIWFTELGFPAVDKATNQPNVFVDPKSSESSAPYFSNRSHDPDIQSIAIKSVLSYWGDETNNPVSKVYNGPMIDVSRTHIWAWDARPWPDFPMRTSTWSDGENFELGHWVSGRMGGTELSALVAEICEYAGVTSYDVSSLTRMVTGFTISSTQTARSSLEALMTAYNFNCVEVEGVLVFQMLPMAKNWVLDAQGFVVDDSKTEAFQLTRNSNVSMPDQLFLSFWNPDQNYQYAQVDAQTTSAGSPTVSKVELPVVLSNNQAHSVAKDLLSEMRQGREKITFTVPPSQTEIQVGDVFSIAGAVSPAEFRIEGIEEQGVRVIEASRVDLFKTLPKTISNTRSTLPEVLVPASVYGEILNLPQLSAQASGSAPYVAISANPWPGQVAVYSAGDGVAYELEYVANRASIFGTTLEPLKKANAHYWSRVSMDVSISNGALASVSDAQVFDGKNAVAIRAQEDDEWEVFQFANAVLNADGSYTLSRLLRGQLGTDAYIPDSYPAGSQLVFLDDNIGQLSVSEAQILVPRSYRIGPAAKAHSDESYDEYVVAPQGTGLRPFSPVHLRAALQGNGDIALSWIRRTRQFGDYWNAKEVPLVEDNETYQVQVVQGGMVLREETLGAAHFDYDVSMQTTDGVSGGIEFLVCQVSDIYGAGPTTRIEINV